MRTEPIITGMLAISDLARTVRTLPTMRAADAAPAPSAAVSKQLSHATQQAHDAAALLGELGFSTRSVHAATHAAKLLESGPFTAASSRQVLSQLSTINRVESAAIKAAIASHGAQHLPAAAAGRDRAAIREIGKLTQLADAGRVFPSLARIDDAARATLLDGRLADELSPAIEQAAVRAELSGAKPAIDRAAERLTQQDAANMTRVDWSTVQELLAVDGSGTASGIVAQLDGYPPLTKIVGLMLDGDPAAAPAAQRYLEAWRIARMGPDQHAQRVDELLGTHGSKLQEADWFALGRLLTHQHARPGITVPDESASRFIMQRSSDEARGWGRPDGHAQVRMSEWTLRKLAPEDQARVADELLAKRGNKLDERAWSQIAALRRLDPYGVTTGMPEDIDGISSFWDISRLRASGMDASDADTKRYLDIWRGHASSRVQKQLEGALTKLIAGSNDAAARWLVLAHANHLDRATSHLPQPQRLAYAARVLDVQSIATSRGVAATLRMFRDSMPAADSLPKPLQRERAQALKLVEQSLQQMSGPKPAQPDAAHIAQVRTTAELLVDHQYETTVRGAVAELATGTASAKARALVEYNVDTIDSMTAGMPWADRVGAAAILLSEPRICLTELAAGPLRMIRDSMPSARSMQPDMRPARREMLDLIDRSLQRLAGDTPAGEAAGFDEAADLGQVGEIRAHAELIESLSRADAAPAQPALGTGLVRW